MTREEKEELKGLAASMGLYNDKKPCKRAVILGKAIKALDQEPIIDKIRAEIGNINLNEVAAKYEDRFYGFQREVIKILDKYKAESEEV